MSSRHGVSVTEADGREHTCILLGGAGASTVHERSAVLLPEALYVACGDAVCALTVPALDVRWWRVVDEVTCYGVYALPDETGLISHGELSIARVSLDGEIVWSASGPDIFTGALTLLPDRVQVIDWNDTVYAFALSNGEPAAAV